MGTKKYNNGRRKFNKKYPDTYEFFLTGCSNLPVGLSSSEETATRGMVGSGILMADRMVFFVTMGEESLSFCEESEVDSAPCTLILERGVLEWKDNESYRVGSSQHQVTFEC